MLYRRSKTCGASYFFTVNLADRQSRLLLDYSETLRDAFRQVKKRHPFHIDAVVILPDHLHTIWTLPDGDSDYPMRWGLIKAGFSRNIEMNEPRSKSRKLKRERGIWQRRYWEHQIKDETDYNHHVDYIHINPVKHGYVAQASMWDYSSIHRYIEMGMVDESWAYKIDDLEMSDFGEREYMA
ncbi:Transposase and inactivated derivatives [hydrothermal vent metagenome]|uniref:Transposase and inactivated derivatives n=1 Tax=hydrothermal vent metagenome TaxID=652676 RepID=A0A3B1BHV6_9ZZZZ